MNSLQRELLLCIPGPWRDRSEFVRAVITETNGEFMFAGMILACPSRKDHVPVEFAPHDPRMLEAFCIAGKRNLSEPVLDQIEKHCGAAYLHFPVGIISQKERVRAFTEALKCCGGLAVKVESTGVAHEWEQWFSALNSENPFDLYRTFVTLIGDAEHYYSCGMHHFGLPDVEVERSVDINEAADLMNQFNYWQIVEEPKIAPGHTFSLTADAPHYRISQRADFRHEPSDFFHNANGLWSLARVGKRY